MRKYLVIQLARFGDILQTRRLIKSLQQDGEVFLCVDKTQETLARLAYGEEVQVLALHAFKADTYSVLTENRALFAYLQEQAFEHVFVLNHSPLSYALARLFPHECLRGYIVKEGQDLRSNWANLAFRYMNNRFQAPLHICDYWTFFADNPIAASEVNPSAYEKMLHWQKGQGKFTIAIVLAGQNLRRSVPVRDYAQIIKVLASRFESAEFILLGTQTEHALAHEFLSSLPQNLKEHCVDLVGKTNMQELFSRIKECDLLVSPDTGSLHCAAFLGVPTLSFFCSSAFCFETGAYGLGHVCVQATTHCAPCVERMKCINTKCHTMFSSPALLARLSSRKTQKEIIDFCMLQSDFDEIGLTYTLQEGTINPRNEAEILRKLLFEYRHNSVEMPHTSDVDIFAGALFDMKDFFPQNRP